MRGNRGFTLLEVLLFATMTSVILLVLLTTLGFSKDTFNQLVIESEQNYALRNISSFLYREVRLIDKDKEVNIEANQNRGTKLTYWPLGADRSRSIEVSFNHNLFYRNDGQRAEIVAANVTYIDFNLDGELLIVEFVVSDKDYKLVIPWN